MWGFFVYICFVCFCFQDRKGERGREGRKERRDELFIELIGLPRDSCNDQGISKTNAQIPFLPHSSWVFVPWEELRPSANLSYKPGSLRTIYSPGLLGRSLPKWIIPALSNSKQLLTALGHNPVCLSAFTYQYLGSHWMHRGKQG